MVMGASSLECSPAAGPTKFMIGTEQGPILSCNRKAKTPQDRVTGSYPGAPAVAWSVAGQDTCSFALRVCGTCVRACLRACVLMCVRGWVGGWVGVRACVCVCVCVCAADMASRKPAADAGAACRPPWPGSVADQASILPQVLPVGGRLDRARVERGPQVPHRHQ